MSSTVEFVDGFYIFECPHCKVPILVNKKELNCCIFRHGVFKKNNKQVPPHLSKKECKKLIKSGIIHGCCKPFQFIKNEDIKKCVVIICDYK